MPLETAPEGQQDAQAYGHSACCTPQRLPLLPTHELIEKLPQNGAPHRIRGGHPRWPPPLGPPWRLEDLRKINATYWPLKNERAIYKALRLGHSAHHTTAHCFKGSHGPQSRSATPCMPPAERPSGTLEAQPHLRVRIAKQFGSAKYAVLNEVTY
eukprot:4954933-Pleurochrysis_carterae.AAC.1